MNGTMLGLLALTTILISGGFWVRGTLQVSLPKNRGLFVLSWLVTVALGIAALRAGVEGWSKVPVIVSFVISGIFLFTFSISKQKLPPNAIKVGQSLPNFTSLDENDEAFDSATLSGKPVLMKFFRGHW